MSDSSEGQADEEDANISNVSEKFQILNNAATEIQKIFKGYLTRKQIGRASCRERVLNLV